MPKKSVRKIKKYIFCVKQISKCETCFLVLFSRVFQKNFHRSDFFKTYALKKNYLQTNPINFHSLKVTKELSLWNEIKYLNLNIFRTRFCKPLIFQTQISWSNRIHSLKYLRSATFGSKDIVIKKSEFAAKTQFLSQEKFEFTVKSVKWYNRKSLVNIWNIL